MFLLTRNHLPPSADHSFRKNRSFFFCLGHPATQFISHPVDLWIPEKGHAVDEIISVQMRRIKDLVTAEEIPQGCIVESDISLLHRSQPYDRPDFWTPTLSEPGERLFIAAFLPDPSSYTLHTIFQRECEKQAAEARQQSRQSNL